jgi:thioredoxin 1
MILDAAVDDRDLVGEPGEERGLLHGRVATADDGDVLAAEEEAVARGAGGDAVADQLGLPVEPQHQRLGSGRDDDGPGTMQLLAHPDPERPLGEVDRGDLLGAELGPEAQCLVAEHLHELRALDAIREAGIVLHVGRQHQLAAGLVGRRRGFTLEEDRRQVGARRVHGGGQASGPRSDDDDVAYLVHDLPRLERPAGALLVESQPRTGGQASLPGCGNAAHSPGVVPTATPAGTGAQRGSRMSHGISTLTSDTFDETVKGSDKPVLVDFWAEWCGPCKMIAPILEEIAAEEDAIAIAKLNVDECQDVAMRYEVMSIPTLLVFKEGQVAKRIVGARPKGALLEDLAEYL